MNQKIDNLYESDEWKLNRPIDLKGKIEGSTPNFVFFRDAQSDLRDINFKIFNENHDLIPFSSLEQCWNIFIPSSYTVGGFSNPMPKCEKFQYFRGTARIFYWKLSFIAKYTLEMIVKKAQKSEPFQFGLFLPFKQMRIPVDGICIQTKNDVRLKQGYLKRIDYFESRKPSFKIMDFIDSSEFKTIYLFKGDGIHKLDGFEATNSIEIKDYEILFFELFPSRNIVSKLDLFPLLKTDFEFRQEVGINNYEKLIKDVRKIPEKCRRYTTGEMCKDCSVKPERLCIVNLLGILCSSEILPHHGFEYSDLLIELLDANKLVPVIVKGPSKITWGQNQGLLKQVLEKLLDSQVEIIVIATNAQIGNRVKIYLEYLADCHKKSLIFLSEKELAQFLFKIRKLYSL